MTSILNRMIRCMYKTLILTCSTRRSLLSNIKSLINYPVDFTNRLALKSDKSIAEPMMTKFTGIIIPRRSFLGEFLWIPNIFLFPIPSVFNNISYCKKLRTLSSPLTAAHDWPRKNDITCETSWSASPTRNHTTSVLYCRYGPTSNVIKLS